MALLNATLSGTPRLSERVQAVLASLKQAARRRAVYKRTVRELRALTEREMADLGIHPAMINEVAHEAAYGN